MMTKEELRNDAVASGLNVQQIEAWTLVGELNNVKKYDVAYEYEGIFQTAQVKVVDEGTPEEEATIIAKLTVPEPVPETTFTDRLTTFMRSVEVDPVFAVSRIEVSETDATATVAVYIGVNGDVVRQVFVIRERAGVISFKKIVEEV
jgi:hypothetical protein